MHIAVMVLVLGSACLHALWNSLIKGGGNRMDDTAAMLCGAAISSIPLLLWHPTVNHAAYPFLLASGIVHIAYFWLVAAAYQHGDLSQAYPVSRGSAPLMTAAGSFVLHAGPKRKEAPGIALISLGVLLIAAERWKSGTGNRRVIRLALCNACVIALYTLIDGNGARLSGNPLGYTCWNFCIAALFFNLVNSYIRRCEQTKWSRQTWLRGLLRGCCSLTAYTVVLWAMTHATIASVAALRETSVLFAMLLAWRKHDEDVTPLRWAAAALVVVGAAALKLA